MRKLRLNTEATEYFELHEINPIRIYVGVDSCDTICILTRDKDTRGEPCKMVMLPHITSASSYRYTPQTSVEILRRFAIENDMQVYEFNDMFEFIDWAYERQRRG